MPEPTAKKKNRRTNLHAAARKSLVKKRGRKLAPKKASTKKKRARKLAPKKAATKKKRGRKLAPRKASTKKKRGRKLAPKKAATPKRAAKRLVASRARAPRLADLERRAGTAAVANRGQAEKLVAEITARKRRISDDFHAIGLALARLADGRLYRAAGYRTFEALLKGEKLFGKTVAYKLIAVAAAYPADLAITLGVEKAYHLIAYAEATPAPDLARTLAETNPRIGNQRLDRMSVRDLVAATRRVRSATGSSRKASEAERDARRVAREVQSALRARGARSAKARAKRLEGRWCVQIDVSADDAVILL